jgi:prepilin-type N-terminal cleavage/methylation domain-containing protein
MLMIAHIHHRLADERGFSLIEVLTTVLLFVSLLTFSVSASRHYWLNRALRGGSDQMITQMRQVQEQVVSESHPLVYGVRFDIGGRKWWVLKYDPKNAGTADDTCESIKSGGFESGVYVQAASFNADPYVTAFCKTKVGANSDDQVVLFYPRGSATPGSVTIRQPVLDETKTISVAGVTGRVTGP